MSNPFADALRGLPQFSRIRQEDAKTWLTHVVKNDPARAIWLIGRLGMGFGGSEIGALLLDAQGRQGPFSTALELVNQKLMRVLPSPSNKYMRNGVTLEEAVNRAILRLHGGVVDHSCLDAFRQPCDADPFGLGGNPDFPWIQNGERILVDIKVPGNGEENLHDLDKQFLYCAQLNTYSLLNDARQLPAFDKLMNIHLELPPFIVDTFAQRLQSGGEAALNDVVEGICSLVKYDIPGMRLHFVEQPKNPLINFNGAERPLNEVMKEVAALNWQLVLDGNVPDYARRADVALDEADRLALRDRADDLLDLFTLQAVTQAKIAACQVDIAALCSTVTVTGDLSETPHINIKQVVNVDIEAAVDLAARVGVDVETCRATRDKLGIQAYDTLAMASALENLGQDMTAFIKPAPFDNTLLLRALEDAGMNPARFVSHATSVTSSRKKITLEHVKALSESIDEQVSPLISALQRARDTVREIDAAPDTKPTHTPEHTV